MDLIQNLHQSLEDYYLSRSEKNSLKSILEQEPLDHQTVTLIRNKVIDLANEKVTDKNYRLVIQWMKEVNHLLQSAAVQQSRAFFSPGNDCRNAIVQQMNLAVRELKICVFTISDDAITQAIVDAHRKGLVIRIITDNDKSFDQGSDIARLARHGIPVRMDVTRNHMHHKFMVSDKKSLVTGSYNWTLSAARFNHENILVTRETGPIEAFSKGFDQLWDEMVDFN